MRAVAVLPAGSQAWTDGPVQDEAPLFTRAAEIIDAPAGAARKVDVLCIAGALVAAAPAVQLVTIQIDAAGVAAGQSREAWVVAEAAMRLIVAQVGTHAVAVPDVVLEPAAAETEDLVTDVIVARAGAANIATAVVTTVARRPIEILAVPDAPKRATDPRRAATPARLRAGAGFAGVAAAVVGAGCFAGAAWVARPDAADAWRSPAAAALRAATAAAGSGAAVATAVPAAATGDAWRDARSLLTGVGRTTRSA